MGIGIFGGKKKRNRGEEETRTAYGPLRSDAAPSLADRLKDEMPTAKGEGGRRRLPRLFKNKGKAETDTQTGKPRFADRLRSYQSAHFPGSDRPSVSPGPRHDLRQPSARYAGIEPPQSFRHAHEMREDPGHRRSFMGDMIRLAATVFTAGIFAVMIFHPNSGRDVVRQLAENNPLTPGSLAERACKTGQTLLTTDFAPYEDVLSISPLGTVTAPGEPLPVPYMRVNTKSAEGPFSRRKTSVFAPTDAAIVAIERRLLNTVDAAGETGQAAYWTVHMKPCKDVTIVLDRIDSLSPTLVEAAGGLASFSEIGGPDHIARLSDIRVDANDSLGQSDGFDIALHDGLAEHQALARPERYRRNPYAKAELFNVSPDLIKAITPDHTQARCPLEYFSAADREAWTRKLGDAWGIRRAKGENACRTALIDMPGTAQGAWYTDAAHNGATTKVSAIALAPDTIDPERQIFALHGKLPSLTASMVGHHVSTHGADSVDPISDFVTFESGSGRVNTPFEEIRDEGIYCYENLRVNFIGARIQGVILVQKSSETVRAGNRVDKRDLLRIEARQDFTSCHAVPGDVALSAKATGFFR